MSWLKVTDAPVAEGGVKPRDECSYCGRDVALRSDGLPRRHRHPLGGYCPEGDPR